MLKMIAAVGAKNELGKQGDLCFRIKADMHFFRRTTLGSAVLMGYRTWLSLPGPLAERTNYVLSRDPIDLPAGVHQVKDLDAFVAEWQDSDKTCFVIGGGSVYAQLLPKCQELYLTEIAAECPGADTFFPDFDHTNYTKEILGNGEENGIKFTFAKYIIKS